MKQFSFEILKILQFIDKIAAYEVNWGIFTTGFIWNVVLYFTIKSTFGLNFFQRMHFIYPGGLAGLEIQLGLSCTSNHIWWNTESRDRQSVHIYRNKLMEKNYVLTLHSFKLQSMCREWITLKCNKEQWSPRHILYKILKANPKMVSVLKENVLEFKVWKLNKVQISIQVHLIFLTIEKNKLTL